MLQMMSTVTPRPPSSLLLKTGHHAATSPVALAAFPSLLQMRISTYYFTGALFVVNVMLKMHQFTVRLRCVLTAGMDAIIDDD